MNKQKTIFQFRRGSAAEWRNGNAVLKAGEPGFETDTGKLKVGDGTTPWNGLSYVSDATQTKLVFNAKTHLDFPSIGSVEVIYKASEEKEVYQWNEEETKYERLNALPEIEEINGGNANGQNTKY